MSKNVTNKTLEIERTVFCTLFNEMNKKQSEFLLLPGVNVELEKEFLSTLLDEYSVVTMLVDKRIRETKIHDVQPTVLPRTKPESCYRNIQLEKIPLPKFDGDVRLYSRCPISKIITRLSSCVNVYRVQF